MENRLADAMSVRIKKQRKKLGYTQEEMSERIGISSSSYTKIENAFQNPSLDTLIKISLELKLSLDYMVFGTQRAGIRKDVKSTQAVTAIVKTADIDKLAHASEILNKIIRVLKS